MTCLTCEVLVNWVSMYLCIGIAVDDTSFLPVEGGHCQIQWGSNQNVFPSSM